MFDNFIYIYTKRVALFTGGYGWWCVWVACVWEREEPRQDRACKKFIKRNVIKVWGVLLKTTCLKTHITFHQKMHISKFTFISITVLKSLTKFIFINRYVVPFLLFCRIRLASLSVTFASATTRSSTQVITCTRKVESLAFLSWNKYLYFLYFFSGPECRCKSGNLLPRWSKKLSPLHALKFVAYFLSIKW